MPPKNKEKTGKGHSGSADSKSNQPGRSKPIPIPKTVLNEKDIEELEEQEQAREQKRLCDEAAWRFVTNMRYPKKK